MLPLLLDAAIKGTILLLAAGAAAVLLWRASAAWRHLAWFAAIVGLLVLPLLSAALPAWRVAWLPQWQIASEPAPKDEPLATMAAAAPVVAEAAMSPQPSVGSADSVPADSHAPIGLPQAPPNSPATIVSAGTGPWLMLWLAGALLSLVPPAIGIVQVARLGRRASVVTDPTWLTLLAEARRAVGVRQPVQLRHSADAPIPLTWGALRPVLLLPAEAEAWPLSRRRMVLWHELAHVQRCDWLTQMLAHLACAVHWFNPLAWLAARQMRVERERASDDLVLACGAEPSEYARELLAIAAGLRDPSLAALAAVPMARRLPLEDRLRAILDVRQSRAALTALGASVAALLLASLLIPLAMLRAAGEPPPAAKEPAASPPVLVEPDARLDGIRLSVLDSTGNKPIKEFRVIAGTRSGASDEYEKRTGRTVVNWQPHTLKIGTGGDLVWPLAKAYGEMALRVEADGCQPQTWSWIHKKEGAKHIVFQLAEDPGVPGRVLTPSGQPAAGAMVALAMVQRDAVLEDGRLRHADAPPAEKPGDQWRRPIFAKSDADGRFRLPTEVEPAAVLIVHESGVRELAYDAWAKTPDVTLQGWGQIEGRVLWKDKPGAGQPVSLTVHRHEYGYPGLIAQYADTKTDAEGRFVFDRVLPGHVQLSRPTPTKDGGSLIMAGMFIHLKVKAGEPTAAIIGGQGRTIAGRLAGRDSWEGVTLHFHPEAPHIGFPGDDEHWRAFSELKAGPLGPLFFRDKIKPAADGSFTVEDVLPGSYQLFVSVPGGKEYAGYKQFRIEPEVPGVKPQPQDLGVIQVAGPAPAKPQEPKPQEAKQVDEPKPAPPASRAVAIRGVAVDADTGKPVAPLITQAGKFDPADPNKITWGYSEGRSSATDGSFSTSVNWPQGWTARVLADGYLPQPVIASAPPEGKDEITVTLKLKRGRLVKGQVLDPRGRPVKGIAVFAIGPTGVNLAAGKAWSSWGEEDKVPKSVLTDAAGKFEIPAGDAKTLAVSGAAIDAWPAAIAGQGDATIKLPEPARIDVELSIDGAGDDRQFFYQLLNHRMPGFTGLESSRSFPLKNGDKLSLPALPPGKYQFCRTVRHHLGEFGTGAMLDRQFVELKAGETKLIRYVREKGARLRGKVVSPAGTVLAGIIVSVRSDKKEKDPFDGHEWQTTYASHMAAADGTFFTERISPGKYVLVAEAFTPLTPEQKFRTGIIGPSFRAELPITVPESGELTIADLPLAPLVPGR